MPFLRLLFPLVLGVCVGFYLPVHWGYVCSSLFLFVAMVVVASNGAMSKSYRYRWVFGLLLFGLLFMLGLYRTVEESRCCKDLQEEERPILMAELTEQPREKLNSYAVEAWVEEESLPKGGYALLLYVAKDSCPLDLSRGDVVAFPNSLFRMRTLNPGEFDYEAFLRLRGISGSCYLPTGKWQRVAHRERFSLTSMAWDIQHYLSEKLSRYGLSGKELAVVSAMALGNRDYMETSLRNSYSATGASHILAVSGLHVGVVFWVLDKVLKFFFRSRFRWIRVPLLIASLWGYAFITGLPASVVRASFMLSLVCVGKLIHRSSSVYNTVSASAFFMLLYNPFYLFDVGFQLSYAAVFSILFFHAKVKALHTFQSKPLSGVWSLFSVSVAAQLGTLPIVLYYFHQFPVYFWLSGLWVVPLSSVVIYLSLFFFLLPEVEWLCGVVAKLLSWAAWLMNAGVECMETLPGALVENIRFGGVEVLVSYLVVFVLAVFWVRRNLRWARMLLLSFAFSFGVFGLSGYLVSWGDGLAVYNIRGVSAVNRYGRGINELSCFGDDKLVSKVVSPFWVDHNLPYPQITQRSLFSVGGKAVYCLRDSTFRGKVSPTPFQIEVLVLGKDAVASAEALTHLFSFRLLVLDSSNSWSFRKRMARECERLGIPCWDVVEKGAWVLEKHFEDEAGLNDG